MNINDGGTDLPLVIAALVVWGIYTAVVKVREWWAR
jgi:hypothetical protein